MGPLTELTNSVSTPADRIILEGEFIRNNQETAPRILFDYSFQQQTPLSLDNVNENGTKETDQPQDDPDITVLEIEASQLQFTPAKSQKRQLIQSIDQDISLLKQEIMSQFASDDLLL